MRDTTRWIKRLAAAALGGGASLVIAACYGVSQCIQKRVAVGRVTYQHQGIPGIQVCADTGSGCITTDGNGNFDLQVCTYGGLEDGSRVQVSFKDVDGPENGGEFQDQTTTVTVNEDNPPTVNVEMVPVGQ